MPPWHIYTLKHPKEPQGPARFTTSTQVSASCPDPTPGRAYSPLTFGRGHALQGRADIQKLLELIGKST